MIVRSRLVAPLVAVLVGLALASCSDEEEGSTGAPPADLPEDLCAALAPVVPDELGLDQTTAGGGEDEGSVTETCTLTGEGAARLEAELTSYAVADVDDPAEVRLAQRSACDQLLGQTGAERAEDGEGECRATLPGGTVSSVYQLPADQGVLRLQVVLPDSSAEQAEAYSSAIAYGMTVRD